MSISRKVSDGLLVLESGDTFKTSRYPGFVRALQEQDSYKGVGEEYPAISPDNCRSNIKGVSKALTEQSPTEMVY